MSSGTTTNNCSPTTTIVDPHDSSDFESLSNKKMSTGSPEYEGIGTVESPFIVTFANGEESNPYNFNMTKKILILAVVSMLTLCVAFGSSVYAGGIFAMKEYFEASSEVLTLGLSLYVLGFVFGPLIWAPIGEMYGRRVTFVYSYAVFALFQIGCALAQNLETLLVCRFFAGLFGASPLVNSGGVIADMFDARERGIAISYWSLAPFLGPVIGPIAGGYLGSSVSWRWIFWLMTFFAGLMWILGSMVPETYAPVLLRRRALALSAATGLVYVSRFEVGMPPESLTLKSRLKINLTRPFVLLFTESIVLLFSIYAAIVYGILYLLFGAFPLVFQVGHGFTPGEGGLAFIGVGVGMVIGVCINVQENGRYVKLMEKSGNGMVPPEERLRMCCIGGMMLPIGLAWFAASSAPTTHWIVPILGTALFGCGMLLVFLSLSNYLIDSYLLYAASALAANAVLRSLMGAAFPLFTLQMFAKLGNAWALGVLALISLLCVPIPFLFMRYGHVIRRKSKFAPTHEPIIAKDTDTDFEKQVQAEIRLADKIEEEDVEKELQREAGERNKVSV